MHRRGYVVMMRLATVVVLLVLCLAVGCKQVETSVDPVAPNADDESPVPLASSAGDIWLRPVYGMSLVYVPGGTFQMGSGEDDPLAGVNEFPSHSVTVDGYWIDRTEVSNAQYSRCVDAGICTVSVYAWDSSYNAPDLPAVGVGWQDAGDYCGWAGGRLPTEAEWEYAARGAESRIYPWGNDFDGTRLNYCDANCDEGDWADGVVDDGYVQSGPVASFPGGASWCGALDLAGNVWEWVADWDGEYSEESQTNPTGPESGRNRVLRGGCWANELGGVRGAYRLAMSAITRHANIGFRCVVSASTSVE